MSAPSADYFANHARRNRFPWSLYHAELERRIGDAVSTLGVGAAKPRVLVVGCGLDTGIEGAPGADVFGCDLDARAIAACKRAEPWRADHFAACESAMALPRGGPFDAPFDAVVAKEVIEHTEDPAAWAAVLTGRVRLGGELILTTPNYGRFSSLPLLESTLLEWIARRDGFSRKHIHPSRFDKRRLERLDVGAGMRLVGVARTRTGWSLFGRWRRVA